jgi:hypothetical protein
MHKRARKSTWDDGAVVPLSEQINELFAPPRPRDDDDELLGADGSFAAPRGPALAQEEAIAGA